MKRHLVILGFLCGVFTATAASAQDKGRTGLVMGYPAMFAVLWHPTEAIGIRPELSISKGSSTATFPTPSGTSTTKSSNWSTGVGVSLLFYGATKDNLRVYFSPRGVYAHTSSTTQGTVTSTSSSNSYSASGSAGAQYALGHRFSAYGEVGVSYARTTSPGARSNSVGVRSAVGAILYF